MLAARRPRENTRSAREELCPAGNQSCGQLLMCGATLHSSGGACICMCVWWCVHVYNVCVFDVYVYDGVYVCIYVYMYVYDTCMWWWSSEDNIVVFVLSFHLCVCFGGWTQVTMCAWQMLDSPSHLCCLGLLLQQMFIQSECLPPSPGKLLS